jgi:hypothetical protein
MQSAKTITITRVEHQLNSLALQLTAADPDQCSNPRRQAFEFENFSGSKGVEVAEQDVKAVLVTFNTVEQ